MRGSRDNARNLDDHRLLRVGIAIVCVIFLLCGWTRESFAARWLPFGTASSLVESSKVAILHTSSDSIVLRFSCPGVLSDEVTMDGEMYIDLRLPGGDTNWTPGVAITPRYQADPCNSRL